MTSSRTFLAALALLSCAACSRSTRPAAAPPPPAPPPAPAVVETQADTSPPPEMQRAPSNATGVRVDRGVLAACSLPQVSGFLPFNPDDLVTSNLTTLDAIATCFSTGPMQGRSLLILGREIPAVADDGTTVLGTRANAVADYLISRGAERSRVIVTRKDSQSDLDKDDNGWSYERRVDIQMRP